MSVFILMSGKRQLPSDDTNSFHLLKGYWLKLDLLFLSPYYLFCVNLRVSKGKACKHFFMFLLFCGSWLLTKHTQILNVILISKGFAKCLIYA